MKNFTSAICYKSERQAIFQCEEYSFAKHAHFQDKQKYRTSMISWELSRHHPIWIIKGRLS